MRTFRSCRDHQVTDHGARADRERERDRRGFGVGEHSRWPAFERVLREPEGVHSDQLGPARRAAVSERFTRALIDLAARGVHTHCSDPGSRHLRLSEDAAKPAEGPGSASAAQSSWSAGL
jgi:hypothetical protein